MEFRDVVERRRTTRQFTGEPLARGQIERIVSAGVKAPSFDHARRWSFIVLDDAAAKAAALACIEPLPCAIAAPKTPLQEMIKIAFPRQRSMFAEAPCVILPLYRRDGRIADEPPPRGLMDCAEMWCVIENIFLAATDEGLSCAMRIPTAGQSEAILRAAGCAEPFELPCIIGLGHPAPDAQYPAQVYPALDACLHWNKW